MLHTLAVLAHQGGWDEALIVGVGIPGALFVLWKVLDRARGGPTEPHKWDRDASHTSPGDDADAGDADPGAGAGDAAAGDGRD